MNQPKSFTQSVTLSIGPPEQARKILLARTIVAALGERMAPQRWRAQFLSDVGLRALTRVFPRTAASAALNSVLIVARVLDLSSPSPDLRKSAAKCSSVLENMSGSVADGATVDCE
jgi:hypothetical protein